MAFAECENGHIYDIALHIKCPYCNNKEVRIDFSREPESVGKTVPVAESVGKTVPVTESVGKTVPVTESIGKTVPVAEAIDKTQPIYGWLVCLEGKERGRDYKITSDNCTVGTESGADIRVEMPGCNYCGTMFRICFDGRGKDFYLVPDSSFTDIYIEDEPVYGQRKIESRTCIEIGGQKLVFIAFCGLDYNWN